MQTYEEREAAVWGELDAAEDLIARMPDDERAQEILEAAQARARAFTSECAACRALAWTCLRCRAPEPGPLSVEWTSIGPRCTFCSRAMRRWGYGWTCGCGQVVDKNGEDHARI